MNATVPPGTYVSASMTTAPRTIASSAAVLCVVGDLGWRSQQWHHVVATWRNANSWRADGAAEVWIDGVRPGWTEGYEHRVAWDVGAITIALGQRFQGRFDEVLILDTMLGEDQIGALYNRPI